MNSIIIWQVIDIQEGCAVCDYFILEYSPIMLTSTRVLFAETEVIIH